MPEEKQFGVLMHEEMAIRGDLVYDRIGDSIVGFVNPDSWSFEDKVCIFLCRQEKSIKDISYYLK